MEPKDYLEEEGKNLPLAMAYVPMQRWEKLYTPDVGFIRGTIFTQLDLPFIGEKEERT